MDGLQEEWGEACARAPVNPSLKERLTQALPEQISPGDCHFQWETGDRNNPGRLRCSLGCSLGTVELAVTISSTPSSMHNPFLPVHRCFGRPRGHPALLGHP